MTSALASRSAANPTTYLPYEDHADNGHEHTSNDLLFSFPRSQASIHPAVIRDFACVGIVCFVWKRPCHVARVDKATALESILDLSDGTRILVLKQRLPALAQSAV